MQHRLKEVEERLQRFDMFSPDVNEERALGNIEICRQLVELVREVTVSSNSAMYFGGQEKTTEMQSSSNYSLTQESSNNILTTGHTNFFCIESLFDTKQDPARNLEELEQLLPVISRCL